jgi:NarL family two-component system response regulator LiaR
MSKKTPILLVAKSEFVRFATEAASNRGVYFELIGSTDDVAEVPAMVIELCPEVVLANEDIELELLHRAISQGCLGGQTRPKFIVMSENSTDFAYLTAFDVQADALISRSQKLEEIRRVLLETVAGEAFFLEADVRQIRERCRPFSARRILPMLDSVDREILQLVARGLSDKEISSQVFMAHQTVRNRVSRLLQNFAVRNRTELAVLCEKADLWPDGRAA